MNRIEATQSATAIRSGLVKAIPVLLIGALALILQNLPITAYQTFINELGGGFIVEVLSFIYNATFGMLSVFVTVAVSISYAEQRAEKDSGALYSFGAVITSLIVFFILVGVLKDTSAWGALGVKGMFTAIVAGTLAPWLYFKLTAVMKPRAKPYSDGADVGFTRSIGIFLPTLIIICAFALLSAVVSRIFGVNCLHELFISGANAIFRSMGRNIIAGFLMVLLSSVLWFFGIHGSDVLEGVMETLFTPAVAVNQQLAAAGLPPTQILTKEFFDVFVLMGGCGTAMCLLISILLFSRRASNRRLSKMAVLPMLFNINEVMIFGLPVIFNPTLLIPFILTPIAAFFISYAAMASGVVPLITSPVNWTTPVLLGGYQATGSLLGSLLQLFNLALGVIIYRPFVLAYDKKKEQRAKLHLDELVNIMKQSESSVSDVTLSGLSGAPGEIARTLIVDLEYALEHGELTLYYQPQYDDRGRAVGAEALLRWFHPLFGQIYPPLVIELARESGKLAKLERATLTRAVADAKAVWEATGERMEFSINVTAQTLCSAEYAQLLKELMDNDPELFGRICLEITEQTAISSSDEAAERFSRAREMGYRLAIDDFSMGHTSLAYLQEHSFDLVKMDGSIVRGISDNPRCKDIVASIVHLSKSLGFEVLAEFVETDTVRLELEETGCRLYQGYLYSPAVPKEELVKMFRFGRADAKAEKGSIDA